VLSGGNHTDARYKTELYCCTWAEKNKVPILGICHGAFFINYAFKGINAEVENHRGVEHTIAMEGQTHIVNSYHDMCIYELSEEFDAIAQCNEQVEAFKHKSKDIWGIVWHPERMENPVLPTEIRKLIYG
jgi:putative glutamine amidotransferase